MPPRPQASGPPTPGGTGNSMAGLGGWEKHTKGIGSKLLQKMGYKPGQGLGKNSDGRVDPVKLEANQGRAMLGANSTSRARRKDEEDEDEVDEEFLARGRRRRRRRTAVKSKRRPGGSDDDDGNASSSNDDDDGRVAKFESDQSQVEEEEEEEDEDSPEFVARCLLASNKSMIDKLKDECQSERAKQSMLAQTRDDYERDLRVSMDVIGGYEDVLTLIKNLEAVYRNDKLRMSTLWESLCSCASLTTRSHLIQIFALPLLKKQHSRIMIRNRQTQPADSGDTSDRVLENDLFGDMIDVAREWLKTKSGYPALIKWYLEWKTELGLDRPEASKRRRYFRRRLLDVMHLATIKNERDLNSFHYVPYREDFGESVRDFRDRDRYDCDEASHCDEPQQPLNFKQLVEQRASEHDLLFRPVNGRSHESKQVYKLAQLTMYIDNKIIFVHKNGRWQPHTLEDVVKAAQR